MSGRRRIKKRKSRKRLAYGVIAIAFILLCFLTYFSLQQSNQTSGDHATQPQAAIVDHLSRREPNQTFIRTSTTILKERFSVDYYYWTEITVDFYKNLLKHGYSLIILRVHSATTIIDDENVVGLFTWEDYDPESVPAKYRDDIMDDRLVEAYFTEEERALGERYFGIAPKFVERYGNFQNSVIIMMGCEGLKYNVMAEAFRRRGAKVCIGWDGLVSTRHTDHATLDLLQSLILENQTIEEAVGEVDADRDYGSMLKFYPDGAGSYVIPNLRSSLTMNVVYTSPAPKAPKRAKYLAHEQRQGSQH